MGNVTIYAKNESVAVEQCTANDSTCLGGGGCGDCNCMKDQRELFEDCELGDAPFPIRLRGWSPMKVIVRKLVVNESNFGLT